MGRVRRKKWDFFHILAIRAVILIELAQRLVCSSFNTVAIEIFLCQALLQTLSL